MPFVEYALGSVALSTVVDSSPHISPSLELGSDAIFAGLLLLVLSQIWIRGAELEEDQALTV